MSDCPICKGAQYLTVDVPIMHPDFGRLFPCQCYVATLEAKRLQKALDYMGLPADLKAMTFDSFDPHLGVPMLEIPGRSKEAERIRQRLQALTMPLEEHLDKARGRALDFARKPQGSLIFLGGTGAGKTHLAAAVSNYQPYNGGQTTLFVVVPDFLASLRRTFDKDNGGPSYDDVMEAYKSVPLLILDDLGAESLTTWAGEQLYQLINYRYNNRLPLLVTTNEIPQAIDPRLRSRLFDRHRGTAFEILAGDYRLRGKF